MIERSFRCLPRNGWNFVFGLICCLSWLAQAQTPAAKKPAMGTAPRSEEVKFAGTGLQLAGTVLVPKLEAEQRAPAVLLIGATGAATRDGLKFGTTAQPVYRELAEHLAAQGFVVLRYDKRCAGASECAPKPTFDLLVDDARAALAFLRKRSEVDANKVFVFGHAEGGFVASVVASNDEKLTGLVMAAAPGRTLNKLVREQIWFRMKEAGKTPAEISALLTRLDRVVRSMMAGMLDGLSEGFDPKNPYDAVVLDWLQQPDFVIPLFINDPLQVANTITAPVLILQGEKDLEVSVKDAQYLNEALDRAHHKDFTLKLLPEADHLLKRNPGAVSTAVYQQARPLDATLLTTLTEWLQKRAK